MESLAFRGEACPLSLWRERPFFPLDDGHFSSFPVLRVVGQQLLVSEGAWLLYTGRELILIVLLPFRTYRWVVPPAPPKHCNVTYFHDINSTHKFHSGHSILPYHTMSLHSISTCCFSSPVCDFVLGFQWHWILTWSHSIRPDLVALISFWMTWICSPMSCSMFLSFSTWLMWSRWRLNWMCLNSEDDFFQLTLDVICKWPDITTSSLPEVALFTLTSSLLHLNSNSGTEDHNLSELQILTGWDHFWDDWSVRNVRGLGSAYKNKTTYFKRWRRRWQPLRLHLTIVKVSSSTSTFHFASLIFLPSWIFKQLVEAQI